MVERGRSGYVVAWLVRCDCDKDAGEADHELVTDADSFSPMNGVSTSTSPVLMLQTNPSPSMCRLQTYGLSAPFVGSCERWATRWVK